MSSNEKESKSLVPNQDGGVDIQEPGATLPQVPDAETTFKEAMIIYGKLIPLALSATKPQHWIDMGGKPYLTDAGCSVVGGVCRVSFLDRKTEVIPMSDDEGQYHIFITTGLLQFQGKTVDEEGQASTRDKFLTQDGKLKPSDPNVVMNVRKKSISNCYGRGVRRILGLKDLTWEDLKKYNVNADKSAKVQYGKISDAQVKLLFNRFQQAGITAENDRKALIKRVTGKDQYAEIPKGKFNAVLEEIGKAMAARPKNGQAPATSTNGNGAAKPAAPQASDKAEDFIVPCGRDQGKRLGDLTQEQLESNRNWIVNLGNEPRGNAKKLQDALERFSGEKIR